MEINHLHHAKLLLFLDELAKDMGIETGGVSYYDSLETLVDKTLEGLEKIWVEDC